MKITQDLKESMVKKDNVKKRLIISAMQEENLVLAHMESSKNGLSSEQIEENRNLYGSNKITKHKKESLIKRFVEAFINPFTCILIFLAIISAYMDIILAEPGEKKSNYSYYNYSYDFYKWNVKICARNTFWKCCRKLVKVNKDNMHC